MVLLDGYPHLLWPVQTDELYLLTQTHKIGFKEVHLINVWLWTIMVVIN